MFGVIASIDADPKLARGWARCQEREIKWLRFILAISVCLGTLHCRQNGLELGDHGIVSGAFIFQRSVKLSSFQQLLAQVLDGLGGGRIRRRGEREALCSERVSITTRTNAEASSDDATTYLIMLQPHPREQVLRHSEDIPQHVDLKFVKRLIHIGLEQRLQLVQPVLNLKLRLGVNHIAIFVGFGDRGTVAGMRKAQAFWWGGKQARLQTRNRLVNQVIYRVDNVIYERLEVGQHTVSQGVGPRRAAAQRQRGEERSALGQNTHQRGVAEVLCEQGSCRIVHCEIRASTGTKMS